MQTLFFAAKGEIEIIYALGVDIKNK